MLVQEVQAFDDVQRHAGPLVVPVELSWGSRQGLPQIPSLQQDFGLQVCRLSTPNPNPTLLSIQLPVEPLTNQED